MILSRCYFLVSLNNGTLHFPFVTYSYAFYNSLTYIKYNISFSVLKPSVRAISIVYFCLKHEICSLPLLSPRPSMFPENLRKLLDEKTSPVYNRRNSSKTAPVNLVQGCIFLHNYAFLIAQ